MPPKMEQPKQYTPEEIAELEKSRTASDKALGDGGADFVFNESGEKKNLLITKVQKEEIHHDFGKGVEEKTKEEENRVKCEDFLSNWSEKFRDNENIPDEDLLKIARDANKLWRSEFSDDEKYYEASKQLVIENEKSPYVNEEKLKLYEILGGTTRGKLEADKSFIEHKLFSSEENKESESGEIVAEKYGSRLEAVGEKIGGGKKEIPTTIRKRENEDQGRLTELRKELGIKTGGTRIETKKEGMLSAVEKFEEIKKEDQELEKRMEEVKQRVLELSPKGEGYRWTEKLKKDYDALKSKLLWNNRLFNEINSKLWDKRFENQNFDEFEKKFKKELDESVVKISEKVTKDNIKYGAKIKIDGKECYFGYINRENGLLYVSEKRIGKSNNAFGGYDIREINNIEKIKTSFLEKTKGMLGDIKDSFW